MPSLTAIDVVIGQISPKSPSQCSRVRDPRDPVQFTVFVTALVVSLDKLDIVA
jgi:hypothetical protein